MPLADRNAVTGKFTAGNKAAVGRSSSCRNNLQIFRSAITAEDIAALAEILKSKAKAGDLRAIQIMLDFCLPRPAAILAVDDKREREAEAERTREAITNPRRQLI